MLSQVISEFIPKAYLLAQLTVCPIQDVPKVEIVFTRDMVHYNKTVSARHLTEKMREDKDSTAASHEELVIVGATTRVTRGALHVYFNTLKDQSGNTCVYINTATFNLHYSPAIFVAKEVTDLPCTLKTTQEHEQLHVAIDLTTIEEYIPRLKVEVLQYLRALGYAGFGPYTPENAKKKQAQLARELTRANEPMSERLRETIRQRQRTIDTRENYMAEQAKCPQDHDVLAQRLSLAIKDLPPVSKK